MAELYDPYGILKWKPDTSQVGNPAAGPRATYSANAPVQAPQQANPVQQRLLEALEQRRALAAESAAAPQLAEQARIKDLWNSQGLQNFGLRMLTSDRRQNTGAQLGTSLQGTIADTNQRRQLEIEAQKIQRQQRMDSIKADIDSISKNEELRIKQEKDARDTLKFGYDIQKDQRDFEFQQKKFNTEQGRKEQTVWQIKDKDGNLTKVSSNDGGRTDVNGNQLPNDKFQVGKLTPTGPLDALGLNQNLTKAERSRVQQALRSQEEQIGKISDIGKLFAADYLTYTGKAASEIGRWMDKWGEIGSWANNLQQKASGEDLVQFNKDRVRFKNKTEQLFMKWKHDVTGAQATVQEISILRGIFLNSDLGPEEFKGELEGFLQDAIEKANMQREQLTEGLSTEQQAEPSMDLYIKWRSDRKAKEQAPTGSAKQRILDMLK